MAADTGTYRLGRNGRGGAEAGPPTPPPTPPPLKPGIRDRERWEEDTERGRYLLSTYCKGCLQVKMANTVLVWEEGHDYRLERKFNTMQSSNTMET